MLKPSQEQLKRADYGSREITTQKQKKLIIRLSLIAFLLIPQASYADGGRNSSSSISTPNSGDLVIEVEIPSIEAPTTPDQPSSPTNQIFEPVSLPEIPNEFSLFELIERRRGLQSYSNNSIDRDGVTFSYADFTEDGSVGDVIGVNVRWGDLVFTGNFSQSGDTSENLYAVTYSFGRQTSANQNIDQERSRDQQHTAFVIEFSSEIIATLYSLERVHIDIRAIENNQERLALLEEKALTLELLLNKKAITEELIAVSEDDVSEELRGLYNRTLSRNDIQVRLASIEQQIHLQIAELEDGSEVSQLLKEVLNRGAESIPSVTEGTQIIGNDADNQ